jgi:thiamine-phosphate pyrophosphorylase
MTSLARAPLVQQITDVASLPETALFERLRRARESAPRAGARLSVQLRDPQLPARELLRLGESLRAVTRDLGAALVINDRVDLAVILGADGVHLGRRSMGAADARALLGPDAWISMSAHSVDDVLAAAEAGATATLLSPIFASPGKGPPLGTGALAEARAALAAAGRDLLLLALGGVTVETAGACLEAGADGVAAIRADLVPLLLGGAPNPVGSR